MKKFLVTRIGTILITMLVCVALFATVAYAALVQKDVATGVIVLVPQPGINVYSDPAATIPITNIAFGSLYPNDVSAPQTVYVKNIGQIDFTSILITSEGIGDVGSVSYSVNNFPLARDAVSPVVLTLTMGSSPPTGSKYWATRLAAN